MLPIDSSIRRSGWFLRRRDLLARGFNDSQMRAALAAGRIFRVRHGWYSVPDAPEPAIRAIRVGGRLTGVTALLSYGLRVPNRAEFHVAVPAGACRLRRADDRHTRLAPGCGVRVRWADESTDARSVADRGDAGSRWRVSLDDALLEVIRSESRDIAIACCSAVMHHRRWDAARLDAVFARAPARTRCWRGLVSALDESHGETFARLWMIDAGDWFEQQCAVEDVGRFDFRVGPATYLEIDGGQHDPDWTGEGGSTWEKDLDRNLDLTALGGKTIRVSYRMLYTRWPSIRAAIARSVADDLALLARRHRYPYRPRAHRKRRSFDGVVPPW